MVQVIKQLNSGKSKLLLQSLNFPKIISSNFED